MTITAPYGFAPLSKEIHFPTWLKLRAGVLPPLHDVPFEDGISGSFTLCIEAETDIFTRGSTNPQEFFRLPDGRYALPGTSLRGALRNVIEVATFSRFGRVNDHRYSVRDLHNPNVYGNHMAKIVNGQPTPLVQAGWLSKQGGGYQITVCDFAKIEYRKLIALANQNGIKNFAPQFKQGAADKYRLWCGNQSPDAVARLMAKLSITWSRPERVEGTPMLSRFGTVNALDGDTQARLVFTGQPQDNRDFGTKGKHHDFVFVEREAVRVIDVPEREMKDFEFGHSNRGQQNRLGESLTPNDEWGYWKKHLEAGQRMPVFFLMEGENLRAFGLAMMFRLAYRRSIGETIRKLNPDHADTGAALDFAEGLFGTVRQAPDAGQVLALRGRVGISHAVAQGNPGPKPLVVTVLGGPKASYYPNYVQQTKDLRAQDKKRQRYVTWMDDQAIPRGWKRYRPKQGIWEPTVPPKVNLEKVGTRFKPLPAGTMFRAHVDVHNLKPAELGALIWAIEWGGDPEARHTLGMARPLGYGRARLSLEDVKLYDMRDTPVDPQSCHKAFVSYMQGAIDGWAKRVQIVELLSLAKPCSIASTKYQELSPNQFQRAKADYESLPYASEPVENAILEGKDTVANQDSIVLHIYRQPTVELQSGLVAELNEWLGKKDDPEFTVAVRRTGIETDWAPRLRTEPIGTRKAAEAVIRKYITENKKTKEWLNALPGLLDLEVAST
jgi:CRISPR-associated protein (TIGR03986 family)